VAGDFKRALGVRLGGKDTFLSSTWVAPKRSLPGHWGWQDEENHTEQANVKGGEHGRASVI
jgi:hypothetical protein